MITITIKTDSAAWMDAPESEIYYITAQIARHFQDTPCGPNGYVRLLLDSNGNQTGRMVVDYV